MNDNNNNNNPQPCYDTIYVHQCSLGHHRWKILRSFPRGKFIVLVTLNLFIQRWFTSHAPFYMESKVSCHFLAHSISTSFTSPTPRYTLRSFCLTVCMWFSIAHHYCCRWCLRDSIGPFLFCQPFLHIFFFVSVLFSSPVFHSRVRPLRAYAIVSDFFFFVSHALVRFKYRFIGCWLFFFSSHISLVR